MSGYRNSLPQLDGELLLTDGGLETTVIFLEGLELPDFAAFDLLKRPGGDAALLKYFRTYADIATRFGTGMIFESATWRANADWGTRIGYDTPALDHANHRAIAMLAELRHERGAAPQPMVISGCVGPRGDGYQPGHTMTATDAAAYHRRQIDVFADSDADMVSAITMNYADEAIGIAMAAENAGMPVVISFTVETDGRLPTGQTLGDAIEAVEAATSGYPAYYMINCAHPTHIAPACRPLMDRGTQAS
jgi:S-methylmethionine-dependent homocysteine/selenocysteine methylase